MDSHNQHSGTEPPGDEDPVEAYRQIRKLLLGSEQRDLKALRARLESLDGLQETLDQRCRELQTDVGDLTRRLGKVQRDSEDIVHRTLPSALNRRAEADGIDHDELVRALTGPVEECLEQSISQDDRRLAKTLSPVIGKSLNQRIRDRLRAAAEKSGLFRLVRTRSDGKTTLKKPVAIGILTVCAVLACWLALSVRGKWQLDKALNGLRAEPGIIVTEVEDTLFGKPRITGLRDPLALQPAEVAGNYGVNPERLDFDFSPYDSLATGHGKKRSADLDERLDDMRHDLITAIGDLVVATGEVRRHDLQIMTRALFELQFPEVAEMVDIVLEEDRWVLRGELEEPLYSEFLKRVPGMVLTGELDTSQLKNATEANLEKLRADIQSITLIYLSGKAVLSEDGERQSERLVRLIGEHEEESEKLGRKPASFEVHALPVVGASDANDILEMTRLEATGKLLREKAGIDAKRILPSVHDEESQDGRVGIYVKVVEAESDASDDGG